MKSMLPKQFAVKLITIIGKLLYQLADHESSLDSGRIKKILIVKMWAIGEVVCVTPCIRAVRKRFPEGHITFLVSSWAEDVVTDNPYVDEIITVDARIFFKLNLGEISKLVRVLRGKNFDLAVVLHHFVLVSLFTYLCRIPRRIGFDRKGEGFCHTVKVPEDKSIHRIDEYLSVTRVLEIDESTRTEIFWQDKEEKGINDLLRQHEIDLHAHLLIGVLPFGAGNPGRKFERRRWKLDRYAGICDQLIGKKNAKVILLGGKGDIPLRDTILKMMVNRPIDFVGRTTLKQSAIILSKCDLVITHDSGPMHVCDAVETPMVILFGPTDPRLCSPPSNRNIILYKNLSCSPCFRESGYAKRIPPCRRYQCMESLKQEEVMEAIEKQLKRFKGRN